MDVDTVKRCKFERAKWKEDMLKPIRTAFDQERKGRIERSLLSGTQIKAPRKNNPCYRRGFHLKLYHMHDLHTHTHTTNGKNDRVLPTNTHMLIIGIPKNSLRRLQRLNNLRSFREAEMNDNVGCLADCTGGIHVERHTE